MNKISKKFLLIFGTSLVSIFCTVFLLNANENQLAKLPELKLPLQGYETPQILYDTTSMEISIEGTGLSV